MLYLGKIYIYPEKLNGGSMYVLRATVDQPMYP